jgi:Fe-S-cluster-containing hydrogenase component 2
MVCPFDAVKPGTLASIKCDMCPDRDDFACIAACPTKALFAMTGPEFDAYCNAKRFVKKGSLR